MYVRIPMCQLHLSETYTDFVRQYYRWLGLLFAVLALGARFQATLEAQDSSDPSMERDPDLSLYSARMHLYREKIVQCLVLAEYTKHCTPYTVETFMLYFGTKVLASHPPLNGPLTFNSTSGRPTPNSAYMYWSVCLYA